MEDIDSQYPCLFIAEHQTAGRGRNSNLWFSENEGTLLSTWRFRQSTIPHPLLNLKIGLALYSSLSRAWPSIPFALKAPNDIYILGGKCAGILTEVVSGRFVTLHIGIGLNVFSKPFLKNQVTECLNTQVEVTKEDWSTFCCILFKELTDAQYDVRSETLSINEQNLICLALKQYVKNQVKDVLPNGSLLLKNSTIVDWHEL